MNNTDLSITSVLAVLASAFPANKVSSETIKIYQLTLHDIPVDVLENACLHLVATNKFFPTVSEIRDTAHNIMLGMHKIPSAFEAWEEVQRQISLCGDYYRYQIVARKPEYSHPLVEKAVSIMGYRQLCESENLVADRAHFFKVYESLFQRAVSEIKTLPSVRKFTDQYQLTNDQIVLLPSQSESDFCGNLKAPFDV